MAKKITADYLFMQLGLYDSLELDENNCKNIFGLLIESDDIQFDCYCVDCAKETTFKMSTRDNVSSLASNPFIVSSTLDRLNSHAHPLEFVFTCQRTNSHLYSFYFRIVDNCLTKIGQYPSIASLELHTIKKYQKVLSQDYRDFSKAIGLFSHGVGAGSFVYLRRIFENLIDEKRKEAAESSTWDDLLFQQSRMDEKIQILEEHLPMVLVRNRKLYSILSKGIHEMTEEECLDIFPEVKLAIELILDEKIYLLEQQKKIQSVSRFVAATVEKISKKK